MGLRLKFNLILLVVFAIGFITVGIATLGFMERTAIDEARQAATLALDTAASGAVSGRTAQALASRFAETTVREIAIGSKIEADDQAVIDHINIAKTNQFTEIITTPNGARRYVVARVLQASGAGKSVRIASVDLDPIYTRVRNTLITLMAAVGAVFFAVFFVLNIMIDRFIVRPVAEMARTADAVSVGDFSHAHFAAHSKDEIGVLGTAFNRLRRSAEEAIKLLKVPPRQ
jgi:HAMP domain-containing protein